MAFAAVVTRKCIRTNQQGEIHRSASFSKFRESIRRSSAKLIDRLTNRHSANLPANIDFADPESLKRASSLSVLSNGVDADVKSPPPQRVERTTSNVDHR